MQTTHEMYEQMQAEMQERIKNLIKESRANMESGSVDDIEEEKSLQKLLNEHKGTQDALKEIFIEIYSNIFHDQIEAGVLKEEVITELAESALIEFSNLLREVFQEANDSGEELPARNAEEYIAAMVEQAFWIASSYNFPGNIEQLKTSDLETAKFIVPCILSLACMQQEDLVDALYYSTASAISEDMGLGSPNLKQMSMLKTMILKGTDYKVSVVGQPGWPEKYNKPIHSFLERDPRRNDQLQAAAAKTTLQQQAPINKPPPPPGLPPNVHNKPVVFRGGSPRPPANIKQPTVQTSNTTTTGLKDFDDSNTKKYPDSPHNNKNKSGKKG